MILIPVESINIPKKTKIRSHSLIFRISSEYDRWLTLLLYGERFRELNCEYRARTDDNLINGQVLYLLS